MGGNSNALTKADAVRWKENIGKLGARLRDELDWGYTNKVWIHLGYLTWGDLLKAISEEYNLSLRHIQQLHKANETYRLLSNTSGEPGFAINNTIPERHLRPLHPLSSDMKRAVWAQVERELPPEERTAEKIQIIVDSIKPDGRRGIHYHNDNLTNGIATCAVCGNVYDGENSDYCPYCAYTQEQRITHLNQPKPVHVSHNSGNNEWYTPPEYIQAARDVLGFIDTDPASSDKANEIVRASVYYTADNDGLAHDWRGRLWMNPPYAQPDIGHFCRKLADEVDAGNVTEAITLTNNATETAWFRDIASRASAVCFPAGRIKFIDENGNASGAPLQGQAVCYIGENADLFCDRFARLGLVFKK